MVQGDWIRRFIGRGSCLRVPSVSLAKELRWRRVSQTPASVDRVIGYFYAKTGESLLFYPSITRKLRVMQSSSEKHRHHREPETGCEKDYEQRKLGVLRLPSFNTKGVLATPNLL